MENANLPALHQARFSLQHAVMDIFNHGPPLLSENIDNN